MPLLDILFGSAVLLLVASAPGAALLAASRIAEHVPGVLVLPASLVATVVLALPATALRLQLGAPIGWLAAWLGLVLVLCCAVVARRFGARAAVDLLARRVGAAPRWLLALLAAVGVLGALVGASISNDTIYHAAQSLKLERLAAPTFDNTLQFADGGAHPGYLVPVWHDLMALVSWISGLQPVEVYWMSPVVIVGVYVLSWASVGAVAFGARRGAAIGAAAYVVVELLGTSPQLISFAYSAQPRTWVVDIGMPVAIAGLLLALWSPAVQVRRSGLAVCAMAVCAIAFVHVSYLVFLGLGIAGYLLVALVALLRTRRDLLRRHAVVAAVLLVVAGGAVATLTPRLNDLGTFASKGEAARTSKRIDAPRNARVGVLFRGTEQAYRLRPDRLLPQGGIALAALLLGAAALVLLPASPLAWYAAGSVLAMLVARSTTLFPALTDAISPAQSQRLAIAVPLVVMLMLAMEALARWGDAVTRAGAQRRGNGAALAFAVVGALVLIGAASLAWPRIAPSRAAVVPVGAALLAQALFAASALVLVARVARSGGAAAIGEVDAGSGGEGSSGRAGGQASRNARTRRAVVLVTTAGALLALLPLLDRSSAAVRRDLQHRPHGIRVDVLADLPRSVLDALADRPPGEVLLAEPGDSYRLMAAAPVYVVSSEPGHTADVPANRIAARHELVEGFFAADASATERSELLDASRADWLLLNDRAAQGVRRWAADSPQVGSIRARGGGYLLYDVCREACPRR